MQAIGVDADQSYLGPQIITSALKKVDVAVFDAIKSVQDGTYKGGGDVDHEPEERTASGSARSARPARSTRTRSSRSSSRSLDGDDHAARTRYGKRDVRPGT